MLGTSSGIMEVGKSSTGTECPDFERGLFGRANKSHQFRSASSLRRDQDHDHRSKTFDLANPAMLAVSKRRLGPKIVTYGLNAARQSSTTKPVHRQFTTFLASGSLRRRYSTLPPSSIRHIHPRAISYFSIPRFVARAFRLPIAGATVGAGGFGYANYKFDGK